MSKVYHRRISLHKKYQISKKCRPDRTIIEEQKALQANSREKKR